MSDIINSNVDWFDRNAATPEMKRLAEERDAYKRALVMVLKVLREFVNKQAEGARILEAYCVGQAQVADWLRRELNLAKAQLPQDVRETGGTQGISVLDQGYITDGFGNYWSIRCPRCGKETMQVIGPGKVQCSECG